MSTRIFDTGSGSAQRSTTDVKESPANDMVDPYISRWVRGDAAALLVLTLWGVTSTRSSWIWFVALFLLPDLSVLGYLFGPRVGAMAYNAGHLYAGPVGLLAVGVAWHASLATTAALSWVAHIALDNVVGYGLKLPTGFEHTMYGPIGRQRARIARVTAPQHDDHGIIQTTSFHIEEHNRTIQ